MKFIIERRNKNENTKNKLDPELPVLNTAVNGNLHLQASQHFDYNNVKKQYEHRQDT